MDKYEQQTGIRLDLASFALYHFIDQWMGVPYRYGGTTRKGVDCSGFAQNLYKQVYKAELPRSSTDQFKHTRHVRRRRLKEGNLVFFHTEEGKRITHVGVYLGNNKFVHASTSKGVRIDDLKSDYYRKAFVKGGRLKKADEKLALQRMSEQLLLANTFPLGTWLILQHGEELLPGAGCDTTCDAGGN